MSEYIKSLSPTLFWDVDCKTLDDEKHRRFVIGRVLERGKMQDWIKTKEKYGLSLVVHEAQQMRSLDPRSLAFIACLGKVGKDTFRCYTLRHLHRQHWTY